MSASVISVLAGAADGSLDIEGRKRANLVYMVQTTDPGDGVPSVLIAVGLPSIGAVYSFGNDTDESLSLRELTPDQEGQTLWRVTAHYSNDVAQGQSSENPLNRPIEVEWSSTATRVVMEYDFDGYAIINSAGDKFADPPVEADRSILVLVVTRNESYFNAAIAQGYLDTVNSDTFYGAAPGYVRLSAIRAQRRIEGRYIYFAVTYEFQFSTIGWDAVIADRGSRYLDGDGKIQQVQAGGVASTEPRFLDGSGGLLSENSIRVGDLYWFTYQLYERKAFSALGLT